MSKTIIDKEQARKLIDEILEEIKNIKTASEAYWHIVNKEYEDSNLYFLKELSEIFSGNEKSSGIGAKAELMNEICTKVDIALEEYLKDLEKKSNEWMDG